MWCGPPECPYDGTAGCPDNGECLSGCQGDKECALSPCLSEPCDKSVGHCSTPVSSATCLPNGELYSADCTRLGFYLETDNINDGMTLEHFCDVVRSLTLFDPFVVHHGMWIRCELTGWDGPDAYITLSLETDKETEQSLTAVVAGGDLLDHIKAEMANPNSTSVFHHVRLPTLSPEKVVGPANKGQYVCRFFFDI
ncbi:uncharacterized protein LOC118428619 [Branchiostoma floridae]|uniref:Uncharacterized protein LOC118428619 n=1 Tax=Branchiostoma floridae TaxID=7739 RepID=A0A9J7M4K4_BRAFL|nr:uncharacterized protein LOC118428619 [Branchiostoma floridae]